MRPISAPSVFLAIALPALAWAQASLPTGASVAAGSASFSTAGNSMTVRTGGERTIINYSSFSVGAGSAVQFVQPGASSATLNRVIGSDVSQILGSVTSNGQIFLVNPNGIYVGPGGSFSGSSVYLSTGNISDTDFLGGNIRFDPPPSGSSIRIEGRIDATDVIRFDAGSIDLTGSVNSQNGAIIVNSGTAAAMAPSRSPGIGPPPVVSGSAIIEPGAGVLYVNQNGAITNWNQFSIGASEAARFIQPSSSTSVLNRVLGGGREVIYGQLVSNGKVWLTNASGIVVVVAGAVPVSTMKLTSTGPMPSPIVASAPTPPVTSPAPPTLSRSTSNLVDGAITVRVSLVDAVPITLR